MIAAEPYLKTQRVAEALGISVSTVKRWVDSGMIRAARTVGKHRLIPFSEALRLAGSTDSPRRTSRCSRGWLPPGPGWASQQAVALAGEAAPRRAGGRVQDAHPFPLQRGMGRRHPGRRPDPSGDGAHRPRLDGRLARRLPGARSHADRRPRHSATWSIGSAARRPAARWPWGRTPRAIRTCWPGCSASWCSASSAGRCATSACNLPLRSLAQAALRHRPRLIFISVSYLKDEDQFVREYQSFYVKAAAVGAAVIVGGPALGPDIRSRLIYASHGERMAHLAEFARRLSPTGIVRQGGGIRAHEPIRARRGFGSSRTPGVLPRKETR